MQLDHKVQMVQQGQLDLREQQVPLVQEERLDQLGHKVLKVILVLQVQQDLKGKPEQLAQRVQQAQ